MSLINARQWHNTALLNQVDVPRLGPATVNEPNMGGRQGQVGWIYPDRNDALFDTLDAIVLDLNERIYNYDLCATREERISAIQYSYYGTGDYYHAHTDIPFAIHDDEYDRKLSFSLVVSPGSFIGGELEFMVPKPANVNYASPHLIVFPSWMVHRVKPVTVGARVSLVGWVYGPRWR